MDQLEACRICVNCFSLNDMDFINIFEANEQFKLELDFIRGQILQWQLKIHPNDGLPQRICANCFAKFCSIDAFRRECETAQKKLLQSLMPATEHNEPGVENVIKNTDAPLPLLGNYENGSVSIDSASNALVSSLNLTQTDVSLNDFPVYDQQFSHYDNPALIDASSTLLDNNMIAPENTQELSFLASQNLFTFETAEPPTTGTLPLDETESTSLINEILVDKPITQDIIKPDDLEDMLKHSIIPTTAKLNQQGSRPCGDEQSNVNVKLINTVRKENGNQHNIHAMKVKNEYQNTTITFLNHEYPNSDTECDDTDMNIRLKGSSYACHYCFCPENEPIDHLIFPNEDALSQHFFDIHDPNRPYTCPKCPQSFKTKLLRDGHIKVTHKSLEDQTCKYCKKLLKGSVDIHQYNCQYIGNWQCESCNEEFLNTPLYRFRLHQRQHERPKNFKCRLCERSFLKKSNLEAHQRMHKAEGKPTNKCNICRANFHDDIELNRHKLQQHNIETPFKCRFCNKAYSTKAVLQRHINQIHIGNATSNSSNTSPRATSLSSSSASVSSTSSSSSSEQHACLNCSMSFRTLQKLQQHLLFGRDKNGVCLYNSCSKEERRKIQRQGVFPCFHCPRRFHLRSQLDKHLNTHDARLRPFQCEQCVMRCRTPFELKQHVNVAHLNIKAFSCDKCGKCFGYKKDLRDHMLFHAEINVRCTEDGCDYVCKNEKALNDHIRHKHRLLSCEYCHEQFTRQKLTAHLRNIHRSEIDVELAGESDNLYKYQLLNNNNDITQISYNLLNTTQQEQQLTEMLPTSVPVQISSSSSSASASLLSTTSSSLLSTPTCTSITAPVSSLSPLASCITNNGKDTNLSSNSIMTSTPSMMHSMGHHNNQLNAIFVSDPANVNDANLALNNLVASEHDLNLVPNDTSNMFLLPPTSSSTNDSQYDQYFMASLIDTEQEIIVT